MKQLIIALMLVFLFSACTKGQNKPINSSKSIENHLKTDDPANEPMFENTVAYAPGRSSNWTYEKQCEVEFFGPVTIESGTPSSNKQDYVFMNYFNPDAPYYTGLYWDVLTPNCIAPHVPMPGVGYASVAGGYIKIHQDANFNAYTYKKFIIERVDNSEIYDMEIYYSLLDPITGWPNPLSVTLITPAVEAVLESTGIVGMIPSGPVDENGYQNMISFHSRLVLQ